MKRRCRARRQKSDDRASSSGGCQLSRNMSEGSRKGHAGSNMSTPTRRCRRKRSSRATPVYDEGQAVLPGSPASARSSIRGRSPNLNRLLVDRLMAGGRTAVSPVPLGSRSADCTPVSLRKHSSAHGHTHSHHHHHHHHHHQQPELNGKVLKNPHVTKLISSSNCPSPSFEPKYVRVDPYSPVLIKRRSNSLSIGGSMNYFAIPPPPYAPPAAPARAVDNDGDLKYRRLIREAEHLLGHEQMILRNHAKTPPSALSPFHKTGYSPRNLGKPVPTPTPPPPHHFVPYIPEIESAMNNNPPCSPTPLPPSLQNKSTPRNPSGEEGNFLKTISKTLERIMIRNSKDKDKKAKNAPCNIEISSKGQNYPNNNSVSRTPPPITYRTLGGANRMDDFNEEEDGYIAVTIQAKSSDFVNHNEEPFYANDIVGEIQQSVPVHSLCLVNRDNNDNVFPGPTFTTFGHSGLPNTPSREVTERDECPSRRPSRKLGLTLWKEGHLSSPNRDKLTRKDEAVSTPKTPLIPFEAFNLVGLSPPVDTIDPGLISPLPHSEPVKRKVYACSSTFDRLQKSLMVRGEADAEQVPGLLKPKYSADPVDVTSLSTEALRDENLSLKEKVEQLRRRRMEVEERVRSTQAQIDRLRAADISKPHYLP